MKQVKELAPWDWMYEDDVFGVEMPHDGGLGFVSVMGSLGKHYAVAVYLGQEGLEGLRRMEELGRELPPEFVLQVPHLQASLEDREYIAPQDRQVMQKLGLKFRGAHAWPQFRSLRPGCFPWYLEAGEAETLRVALEQLLDVAGRILKHPEILRPTDSEEDYLVRVRDGETWKDSVRSFGRLPPKAVRLDMEREIFERFKRLPPGRLTVEVDLFMLKSPVQDKQAERPYFPFELLLADHDSGYLLGFELFSPLPSLEAMWAGVPEAALRILEKGGKFAPRDFLVRPGILADVMMQAANKIGVPCRATGNLPAIDAARLGLERFLEKF